MLSPLRLDIDALPESSPSWLVDETFVKAHLRIDFADDDELLVAMLRGAVEWAENATQRTLYRRTHRLVLACFPENAYQSIWLPRGKTVSIESITYYAGGVSNELTGPSSTVPGADYQEDLRGDQGAVLMPLRGSVWPSTDYDVIAPVTIEYDAGYAFGSIPSQLQQAVLLAVADAYDLRGTADFAAINIGEAGKTLAVRESLISPYRLSRWF